MPFVRQWSSISIKARFIYFRGSQRERYRNGRLISSIVDILRGRQESVLVTFCNQRNSDIVSNAFCGDECIDNTPTAIVYFATKFIMEPYLSTGLPFERPGCGSNAHQWLTCGTASLSAVYLRVEYTTIRTAAHTDKLHVRLQVHDRKLLSSRYEFEKFYWIFAALFARGCVHRKQCEPVRIALSIAQPCRNDKRLWCSPYDC